MFIGTHQNIKARNILADTESEISPLTLTILGGGADLAKCRKNKRKQPYHNYTANILKIA